jgi:hypothetical protein
VGFERRQDPGARTVTQPGDLAQSPGKQTRVAAELERADGAAPTPGKQTRVHAELEAFAVGSGPVQRKAMAPGGAPTAPGNHGPTQAKADADAVDIAPPGAQPRVEQLAGPDGAEALDPGAASTAPIQKAPTGQPAKGKKQFIPFRITVGKPMTREEFEAAANLQMFGTTAIPSQWHNVKDAYTPADSPVEVLFEASLVRRVRGAASAAKGIDTDATGKVTGADARAKDFQAQPASDEKAALLAEIDRRYHAASGTAPGSKIRSNESGKAELWRSIRDEVLFQHQHLASLPDRVKALIHASIQGRDLTPADYDQLFRIAKKIEALPPGAAADYASKITGSTADLAAFEAAIDSYRGELAGRERADVDRTTVQNKLLGLEEVYRLYREYLTTPIEAAPPDMREQLERQLARNGFASIDEFAAYIARFQKAFEDGAVRITLDVLAKYAGKLHKEAQRYQDPAVVKDLHGRLGGFRTQFQDFDQNARIWNDYAAHANRDAEQSRLPGNGHIHARPPTAEQAHAGEKAKAARASAEAQIKDLSKDHPIFAEDDLPVDRRLDKTALARASESELAGVLQSHLASRAAVVAEARGQLEGKHELIYKMDRLMPTFYAEMDIQPGSIHDQIVKDKIHDDAIAKLVGGILLEIVAIALTVVSLGAATPAVVAAGASIGAAGLSTYMAYDEYKQYAAEHAVADAGLADDPSVVWLVLAIVGAGVDMAAATKAVRALAPAARTLHAGGEISDFTKAVEALQKSRQLDDQIAAAAEKAAAARKAYAAAKGELSAALGKAYAFPGPLSDPDVYRALVKMAAARIKEGSHSLAGFIAEIKQARLAAKLAELTPEELTKAKQAWEDAERLAKSATAPVDITSDSGRIIGRYQHGSQLEIIPRSKKDVLHGGNTIRLDTDTTTTVTGTLDNVNTVAQRGERLPGATLMGENPGGINILRSPQWRAIQEKYRSALEAGDHQGYWKLVTDEFWETMNKPWLDAAMARGDKFRFVSNPADEAAIFVRERDAFVLDANGRRIQSIFGREVEYLRAHGYTFLPDGTAVKIK